MARDDYAWLGSRTAYAVRLVLSLGLAYAFASLAIDTGRWLHYFLAIVCLLLSLRFIGKIVRGNGKRS